MRLDRTLALALACMLGAACRTVDHHPPSAPTPPPAAAAPAATAPAVPSTRPVIPADWFPCPRVPDSIHWVRDSAEHRAAVLQAYRYATLVIEQEAAKRAGHGWAVILDADETTIDNSWYQKARAEQGLGYTRETWAQWVEQRSAPALPGAPAFLHRVRELGGRIAVVTNRRQALCPATEDDLRKYDLTFDVLLCKGDDPQASDEKEPRFEAVARGEAIPGSGPLEIVMWVGDNIGDFPNQTQELRKEPEAAMEPFGRRFIVIPNPMYGSWYENPKE